MHSKILALSFVASTLAALVPAEPAGAIVSGCPPNTSVNGTAGPWSTTTNPGFAYGDGAQTGAAIVSGGCDFSAERVFVLNYSSGTTQTNPTAGLVDANGYVGLLLRSNAPGAYTGPAPNLNEVVGTFATSGGAITGTPFIVGNGPALLFSPGGTTDQLQLGVNDDHYADNSGAVTMSVQQLPVTNWTGAADHNFANSGNWDNGLVTGTIEGIIDGNVDSSPVNGTGIILGANPGDTTALALINGATLNDDIIVGDAGVGGFDNNNSTHNVTGNVILGNQSTGNGTYTIEGNSAQTNVNFAGTSGNPPPQTPNGALIVGEAGTGSFTQGLADFSDPNNQVNVAGDLIIGHQGSGSSPAVQDSVGTYTLNDGTLTVGGNVGVGTASTGNNVFTQNGGTLKITGSASGDTRYGGVGTNDHTGELFIGGGAGANNDGGNGTYYLNGGEIDANLIEVGHTGTGTFNQSGGTVNASIWLGNAGGSNGAYNLSGGTINAGSEDIALFGNGQFVQTGGVNSITNELDVGYESGQGTFSLSHGSVTSGTTIIGDGNAYTCGDGCGGPYFGGSGTLDVSGDGSLTTGVMTVGIFAQGTVNQSGGTVAATSLSIASAGSSAQPVDTYNLTGTGVLNVSGDETVGVEGNGNFVQGTTADAGATQNNVTGTLFIGDAFDGRVTPDGAPNIREGSYTLNTGTLTTAKTDVGTTSIGSFTQNGGTHTTNSLVIGDQNLPTAPGCFDGTSFTCTTGGPSQGTYTMAGGTLNVNATAASSYTDGNMTVGDAGNGNLTIHSGTINVENTTQVGVNGIGTVKQDGGIFNTGVLDLSVPAGSGSSSYTLTGGTLNTVANATTGTFGDLNVGGSGTGSATFTQSGSSSVNVDGTLRVGSVNGNASYMQTGGTVTTGDNVIIGNRSVDTGSYSISGASLTVGNNAANAGSGNYNNPQNSLIVGASGTGTFTEGAFAHVNIGSDSFASSTNPAVQDLILGENSGSSGTYNMNGGTLSVFGNSNFNNSSIEVGFLDTSFSGGGTGKFVQTGGVVDTYGVNGLAIGDTAAGTSNEYDISNGALSLNQNPTVHKNSFDGNSTGNLFVGAHEEGTLKQTGGSVSVAGDAFVGFADSANGKWTIDNTAKTSPSTVTIGGDMYVGGTTGLFKDNMANPVDTNGTGEVDQSAGDVNITGKLDVGAGKTSHGTYNLSGGTLEDNLIVGDAGTGTFSNTGGTHTVTGNLVVGNQSTGNGTYTLGGIGNLTLATTGAQIILGNDSGASNKGTFNFNIAPLDAGTVTFSGTGDQIIVGYNGNGYLNVGGGDLNLRDSGVGLDIAANANSFGQLNISGGTLETLGLNVGDAGSGQLNMSGGALTIGSSTIAANLVLGNQTGSLGVASIYGTNPNLTVWGDATIGNNAYGKLVESTGTVDVKGSMFIANSAAGGEVDVNAGSLTVGDGGTGKQLLISSHGILSIGDSGGGGLPGGQVTVDGILTNNGTLELGLHTDSSPVSTLTVTGGLQNNAFFNFITGALNANVTNATTGNIYAQNGAGTVDVLTGNISNSGTVTISELGAKQSTFTENGTFTNNAGGLLDVTNSNVTIAGQSGADALDNNKNGTVNFRNDPNSTTTPPYQASLVALNGNVNNSGAMNVLGSNVTITGNNALNPALDNFGTLVIGTGSNSQGSNFTVKNGNTTNEAGATIHVTGSTANFGGTFINSGAYKSDPSTSNFNDLTITSTGYLSGGSGDIFDLKGNFLNDSLDTSDWKTSAATLEFSTGTGTGHDLTTLDPSVFTWGELNLDPGNTLTALSDLYAADIDGFDFSGNTVTNVYSFFDIFYDPTASGFSGQYLLQDGGCLVPDGTQIGPNFVCTTGGGGGGGGGGNSVPEPLTILIFAAGLVGLASQRRKLGLAKAA